MNLQEYLALITSEHTGKQRFEATVAAGVSPLAKVQDVLNSLVEEFDIDNAVGVQLDVLGIWIGFSRRIFVPVSGVYFSFDSLSEEGWDSGRWKDTFDPDFGPTELTDDEYRVVLKAKISFNSWNGSIPDAYSVWQQAFGDESFILIQDNQDMSMTVAVAGQELSEFEKRLLIASNLLMKPEGVRLADVVFTRTKGKLFCFDTESEKLAGFDSGNWSESYFEI